MAFERLTEEVKNVSALPNVIVGQASTLKATFDEAGSDIKDFINNFLTALETFSAASNIGAMNGELQSNLQTIIDEFATSIANRYTKAEIDSKVSTETGDLVKTLDIDLNTGVFTITKKDGTVETIDTTLEKVPTNFAFVEENGMYYLKVTNTDGTSTQVDVTTLFNDYTFNNTDSIAFSTVKDGNEATITAEIRDASIGIEKLSLTAVSQLEGYVSSANQSAQTATTKANEASESATSALNSANNAATSATSAQTSANNAATSASSASSSAANATSQATLSQSWAVGNTGARDGENTNNAKYWAEQAQASVIIDGEMSDTSENPVQNKVIKSYIDNLMSDAKLYTLRSTATNLTELSEEIKPILIQMCQDYTENGKLGFLYIVNAFKSDYVGIYKIQTNASSIFRLENIQGRKNITIYGKYSNFAIENTILTLSKTTNTISIDSALYPVFNYLELSHNYSSPYEPLYAGSPATKKYVDNLVGDIETVLQTINSGSGV